MSACGCGCGETPKSGKRFVHGHNSRLPRPERRQTYVVEDRGYKTPCHIWQGALSRKGYARARDADGRKVGAHRLAWEAENGPVPDGLQLDHLCRVHPCVRADHLEPVTPAVNSRRGLNTKLVADQVRAIRRRVAAGEKQAALAIEFGIRHGSVANIVAYRSWRDI